MQSKDLKSLPLEILIGALLFINVGYFLYCGIHSLIWPVRVAGWR